MQKPPLWQKLSRILGYIFPSSCLMRFISWRCQGFILGLFECKTYVLLLATTYLNCVQSRKAKAEEIQYHQLHSFSVCSYAKMGMFFSLDDRLLQTSTHSSIDEWPMCSNFHFFHIFQLWHWIRNKNQRAPHQAGTFSSFLIPLNHPLQPSFPGRKMTQGERE